MTPLHLLHPSHGSLKKKVFVIFCPLRINSPQCLWPDFSHSCMFTILSLIKTQRTHEYQKQLHTFIYMLRYIYQPVDINVQTRFPCGLSVSCCVCVISLYSFYLLGCSQTGSFENKTNVCFERWFLLNKKYTRGDMLCSNFTCHQYK